MAVVDENSLVREVEKLLKEIRSEIKYAESSFNYCNAIPPSPSLICNNSKQYDYEKSHNSGGVLAADGVVNSPTTTLSSSQAESTEQGVLLFFVRSFDYF